MDHQLDAKPFHALMDELCAVLRDGFKSTEAMRNAYWDALKDRPFSEVKANAKRWIATATKESRLPTPRELRNQAPSFADPAHEHAERQSIDTWTALRQRDPVQFEVEWRIARAARELAPLAPCDPGYEEITRDYERWAALRHAPRAAQEAMLARVKNQPAACFSDSQTSSQTGSRR